MSFRKRRVADIGTNNTPHKDHDHPRDAEGVIIDAQPDAKGDLTRETTSKAGTQSEVSPSAATMSSATRNELTADMSALTHLNLQTRNPLLRAWLKVNVSVKLVLMLVLPFTALIILLATALTARVSERQATSDTVSLAKLCNLGTALIQEMQDEHAAALWYLARQTNVSGIGDDEGIRPEFMDQTKITDTIIDQMDAYLDSIDPYAIHPEMNFLISIANHRLDDLVNVRYNIRMYRIDNWAIYEFYTKVIQSQFEVINLITTIADERATRLFTSVLDYTQLMRAMEEERLFGATVMHYRDFSLRSRMLWSDAVALREHYSLRTDDVASEATQLEIQKFFRTTVARFVDDLRRAFFTAYNPSDPTALPASVPLGLWWNSTSEMVADMRVFQLRMEDALMQKCESLQDEASSMYAAFVTLCVLACVLPIVFGTFVGWSVRKPWAAMLRMKSVMEVKMKEQDAMNQIVTRFVPHDFLAMMGVSSLRNLKLGECMLKPSTLLVLEILNFAELSERMAPHQSFQFLNTFFGQNAPIIRTRRGFVDKFLGCGFTAIFADPNDALDAGTELLDMAARMNADDSMSSLHVEIGVGIHTGDIMLGTIGEPERMDTTVISESMNIASRINALNRMYGTSMLITRESFMLVNMEGLSNRYIGEIAPRELKSHIKAFEVIRSTQEKKLETMNIFAQAMKHHERSEWKEAERLYDEILEVNPEDLVSIRRKQLAMREEMVDDCREI